MKIKVLALDLEGTLVSNAMSQIPRKGLYDFLAWCLRTFPRVVMFTAVEEEEARAVMEGLVKEELAPKEMTAVDYVQWSGRWKSLSFIEDVVPDQCLIVDDDVEWIAPEDRHRWIPIEYWETPYRSDDELARVKAEICAKIAA